MRYLVTYTKGMFLAGLALSLSLQEIGQIGRCDDFSIEEKDAAGNVIDTIYVSGEPTYRDGLGIPLKPTDDPFTATAMVSYPKMAVVLNGVKTVLKGGGTLKFVYKNTAPGQPTQTAQLQEKLFSSNEEVEATSKANQAQLNKIADVVKQYGEQVTQAFIKEFGRDPSPAELRFTSLRLSVFNQTDVMNRIIAQLTASLGREPTPEEVVEKVDEEIYAQYGMRRPLFSSLQAGAVVSVSFSVVVAGSKKTATLTNMMTTVQYSEVHVVAGTGKGVYASSKIMGIGLQVNGQPTVVGGEDGQSSLSLEALNGKWTACIVNVKKESAVVSFGGWDKSYKPAIEGFMRTNGLFRYALLEAAHTLVVQ